MPKPTDRHGVRRLVDEEAAQLLEVLPRPEYDAAHLPAAHHLSLKDFSSEAAHSLLDQDRPVITYCNDFL